MKAVIDRIEDGKTVVLMVNGGGEMLIPKKQFKFKVYEGMWLDVGFTPDKKSEENARERVIKLQQELLKRNEK